MALFPSSCGGPTAQDAYQRGNKLREADMVADAQIVFEEAIKRDPKYAPPYRALAEMATAAKDYRSAADLWFAYLELEPRAEHGWCRLANAEMMLGFEVPALEHSQKELTLDPECTNAHLYIGLLFTRKGNAKEALTHLEKAAKALPDNPSVQMAYGRVLAQANDYATAEKVLTPLLQTDKNQADPYYWLGYVYARRSNSAEDVKKAESHIRRALELEPTNPRANYELGRLLVRLKRYNEAILPLQQAAATDRNDSAPLFLLAQAHTALNQKVDAADAQAEFKKRSDIENRRKSLLRSYAVNPKDVKTNLELGQLELQRGDANSAMLFLDNARTLAPDNAEVKKIYEETKSRLFILPTPAPKP